MSSRTLCFTCLSKEDLAEATALFAQINGNLESPWTLTAETEADVLVIDMDSMYGQMAWLKAQNAGKTTVGLTVGNRTQASHRLPRPLRAEDMAELLTALSSGAAPSKSLSAEAGQAAYTPPPQPAAHAPLERTLADWLQPGLLPGPVRLVREGAPTLTLDPARQIYHAGTALKPLLPYATGTVAGDELESVSAEALAALPANEAQPWSRLRWLCALAAGQLPRFTSPDTRYGLERWPQLEREFPKHFRIATVMMKGPATIAGIAEASGASVSEVTDFVAAGLASGHVRRA